MNTLITLTVIGCTVIAVIGMVGIKVVDAIRNLDDHMERRTERIVKESNSNAFDTIEFLIRLSDKTAKEKEEVKKSEVKPKEAQETKPPKKVAKKSKQSASEPPTVYGEKWEPIVYTTVQGGEIADKYLISNKGRVWIKDRNRLAKIRYSKSKGFLVVSAQRTNGKGGEYPLKNLVAYTFLRPFNSSQYKVVCIDGNELDCSINNLKLEKIVRG